MTRDAGSDAIRRPAHGAGFALADLKKSFPEHHRAWVSAGVFAVGGGYSVVTLTQLAVGVRPYQEIAVVVLALLAALAIRAGRVSLAAYTVIAAVWAEIHLTMLESPDGAMAASSIALPGLVMGVALLAGGRAAIAMSLATSVSMPATLLLARVLGTGLGLTAHTAVHLAVTIVTMNAAAMMLTLFLRTLAVALNAAEQNANKAQALVEGSPDAVVALSADDRIEAFNAEAERIFAVDRKSMLGASSSDLLRRMRTEAGAEVSELDEGGTVAYQVADRSEIIEGRSSTLGDTQGRILVFRDVSERRKAEAHAGQLQRELHHAQKMEAVGRLAGSVAHDFNNLLTVFGGYSEVLKTSEDAEVREIAEELASAHRRAATLTRQLLAFTRRDTNNPRAIDLGEVIRSALPLLRRLVGERVRLELLADEPCPMTADPSHVEQVIVNLAANSADAMPGGGTLRVECNPFRDHLELVVTDTGVGMDEATMERIFEPFFTTKDAAQGTGLGLATVHRIVGDYGGHIDVRSELGTGTTFVLTWPRGSELSSDRAVSEVPVALTRGQGTVLIVEDDDSARQFLERVLGRAGYEVMAAHSGADALQQMKQRRGRPDLLLTDLSMPDLDGVALAERVRTRHPDLPIVFMSGYTPEQLGIAPPGELGILLAKPFSATELLGVIREHVNRGSLGP